MREILFRGKRIDNGEWVEGFYVCLFEKKDGFYQANHYIFDGNIRFGEETYTGHGNYYKEVIICKRKIYEKTLGQFTGLTDKNGKRVFEGDIIKKTNEGRHPQIFTANIYTSFRANEEVYYSPCDHFTESCEYEIIGNIHDNPELLEK